MTTPVTAPARPVRRPSPTAEDALGWAMVAVLAVLVGLPLLFVLLQGVAPGLGLVRGPVWRPELLAGIVERPLWRAGLVNSLVLAGGAMVLGGALGTGLALLRTGASFPGARLLDATAWILLVSPSFVLAQGWVLLASPIGIAAGLGQHWVAALVLSPGGLVVIMSLTQYPLAYLAVSAALRWDDRAHRQAAALSGAGPWTVLRTVRLPLLWPAVLSGAVLVFVDVLGDFGLPAALSTAYPFPTLPYAIYASVRQSPVRFESAGVLSFYLVAVLSAAMLLYLWAVRRGARGALTGTATRADPPPARRPGRWTALTAVVVGVTLVLPLGSSLLVSLSHSVSGGPTWSNLTLGHYHAAFVEGELLVGARNSVLVALAAAVLTTVLGFLCAVVLTSTGFRARVLVDLAGTVSLAVPGIVLGVGYIFVWNQPVLAAAGLSLYGSPVLLVLAGVASALPVSVRLQVGALARLPDGFLAAAALTGAGLAARIRTVLVPLAGSAVVSAFVAVLAMGVFDLATTTMLAPPGFPTLPVVVLTEFDRGRYGYATAGAVLSAALVLILAALAARQGRRLEAAAGKETR